MIETIAENNFYLLDGNMTVADARDAVTNAPYYYIIIDREDQGEHFYYLYLQENLLSKLARLPKPVPVKLAMRLHEEVPLPTLPHDAPLSAKVESCYIVLKDDPKNLLQVDLSPIFLEGMIMEKAYYTVKITPSMNVDNATLFHIFLLTQQIKLNLKNKR